MVDQAPDEERSKEADRSISVVHSPSFLELLISGGFSLMLTSYQSGKLIFVGGGADRVSASFTDFPKPMGAFGSPERVIVASPTKIWFLNREKSVGQHSNRFICAYSREIGDVAAHELTTYGNEALYLDTRHSCLSRTRLGKRSAVVWRPSFITTHAPEDRCHLNGLSVVDGAATYATALGRTNTPLGWRERKRDGGVLMSIADNTCIATSLCMPHSPREYRGNLWFLNSGFGDLCVADKADGKVVTVARLPGFTRGLAFYDRFAFVGLSKIREKRAFSGLPIEEDMDHLKCGIAVVDITTGALVAYLEFLSGCTELFDVIVLPGMRQASAEPPP